MPTDEDIVRLRHMLDRDRLIHGYFDVDSPDVGRVDLDIVWKIASQDLPPLVSQLKKILARVNESDA